MENIIINQELLLGYLMNVLDEDEISTVESELKKQPKLRNELAKLQKQISPMDILLEMVDPPSDLTQRTCDNIWSAVQNKTFNQNLNLRIFPNAESNNSTTITNFEKSTKNNYTYNKNENEHKHENENENEHENENENENENNINKILYIAPEKENTKQKVDVSITNANYCNDNVAEPARRTRRRSQQYLSNDKPSPKKSMLQPFIFSAVIGILLAIIIYPTTNYFVSQITQLVVRQKVQQLNKSVDVYSQLSDPPAANSPNEINLSNYEWQELIPKTENIFAQNDNFPFIVTKILDDKKPEISNFNFLPISSNNFENNYVNHSSSHPKTITSTSETNDSIFLGQSPISNLPDNAMQNDIHNYDSILNLSKPILISDGLQIKPAVGQSILIQNGRIFFRSPPQIDNNKK
jgi:hypothetical protein